MTIEPVVTDHTSPEPVQQVGRRMYTVAEAAKILGIGRSTAYELILQGELAATRIGRRWLVSPAVLERFLGEPPPPPN